ncbi:unnamed protein product, partial [marine sediment metagenome]
WIIQQCREKWIKDSSKLISWEEIVKLSSTARPFKSFINVNDPIFAQTQVNMPKTINKYCKDKGQALPESIGEISRCIYESLAMKFKHDLNKLEELTGKKIEILHLVGGGIQNKLLCQWTADATGTPVITGPNETTSVGNLIMQLKASGEIKTLGEGRAISLNSSIVSNYKPENRDRWDEEYSKYLKIL